MLDYHIHRVQKILTEIEKADLTLIVKKGELLKNPIPNFGHDILPRDPRRANKLRPQADSNLAYCTKFRSFLALATYLLTCT